MRTAHRIGAALTLATLLAGCRIDPAVEAAPEGYHRMPNGGLMADVVMTTEFRDLGGNGVEVPTHTRPDGTVVLGAAPQHAGDHAGGHDHPVPDPDDFPQGIVPVRIVIPRIGVDAPVVATTMDADGIEGPPVAGDLAWLEQTRRPGEVGPAIFGGVDRLGDEAGAFAELRTLAPGDEFIVHGEGGTALYFRVVETSSVPTARRSEVFAAGGAEAEVRLVDWALDGEDEDHIVRATIIDDGDDT